MPKAGKILSAAGNERADQHPKLDTVPSGSEERNPPNMNSWLAFPEWIYAHSAKGKAESHSEKKSRQAPALFLDKKEEGTSRRESAVRCFQRTNRTAEVAFSTILYVGTSRDYEYFVATRVMIQTILRTGTHADVVVLASEGVPRDWVDIL